MSVPTPTPPALAVDLGGTKVLVGLIDSNVRVLAHERAAIYARYSSENQRPESIEDQVAACRRLAGQRGFTILEEHIYTDRGSSCSTSWPRSRSSSDP
jgi:predicted site-specific integrase-resolvase